MDIVLLIYLVVRFQIGSAIRKLDHRYPCLYLLFQTVKSRGCFFCVGFEPIQDRVPQEENPEITMYINSILWKNIGFLHEFHKDYPSWKIYLPYSWIEGRIASGMEIKLKCEGGKYFEAKECGIHVILDDPHAMDEYMDSVTLKRGRDHQNEAGPSNDSSGNDQLNFFKRLKIKNLDDLDQAQE
jgi:hypothetical protein